MEKRAKRINYLISNLISKSNKRNNELLNRFKICEIFTTLENQNSSNLQSYITESNIRFRKAKTGGNISSLIRTSTNKLTPLSNSILSNHLYQDFDLEKEKAQLRHKLVHKEKKEINQLITDVKEFTTYYTNAEKKFREELNNNIKYKNSINSLNNTNDLFTTLNTTTVTTKTKSRNIYNKFNQTRTERKPKQIKETIDVESLNKKVFKNYVNNDIDITNECIDNYKKNIISISDKLNNVDVEKKDKIKEIENVSEPTTNHLKHKLKLLTYTKPIIIKKRKKGLHEIYTEPIDVVKVFRFIKPTKYELERRKNLPKGNTNTDGFSYTNRSEYSDTKEVVKNVAYKSFCFGDTMKEKRITCDNKLNDNCLPHIDEYDCILKEKVGNNERKRMEYKEKYCTCLTEEDTKRDILRNKLKVRMKRWNIPMEVLHGI